MSWDFREFTFNAIVKGGDRVQVKIAPLPVDGLENEAPAGTFSDLEWERVQIENDTEVKMTAKAKGLPDGAAVRFLIEMLQGANWVHYLAIPGTVKDGVVTGVLQAQHPGAGQGGTPQDPTKARLRFRLQMGKASPQKVKKKKAAPAAN